MLEVLQFIFSSFWVWLGTLILLEVLVGATHNIARGMVKIMTKANEKGGTNE